MAEMDDDLLTVQEVSVFLRKSPSTIYRLTREGRLPARKVGGTWRFSRKGLEAWLLPGSPAAGQPQPSSQFPSNRQTTTA